MNNINWVNTFVSVLSGLAVCIPLAVELAKYITKAVKEKNWGNLLKLVTDYMTEAEKKFGSGAERKEWVLSMVKASADEVNYDVDLEAVGRMIDNLCDMSKVVNASDAEKSKENT